MNKIKVIALFCLLIFSSISFAEGAGDFEQIKGDRLKRIRVELVGLKNKIQNLKAKLETNLDMVSKIQSESKVRRLTKEYDEKSLLFIETTTNVNLGTKIDKEVKTDFIEDLKQILEPALDSIKKVSERPRQVHELNERMEIVKSKIEDANKAKASLESYLKGNTESELKWTLKRSIKQTDKIIEDLFIQKEDIQFKLIKMEDNQESIVTTFSYLIFDFFKTKGKNLFLAVLVFSVVLWLFMFGKDRFISIILFRMNRSNNREIYQWVLRPTRVIYSVLSFLSSLLLGILTLYVLNDWVLVTVIIFVIAAIIWSSKQYIPTFLEQSKIVLNLGTIREGERLVFQELPWEIKSLGYYCILYNPALTGGRLRVSTRQLIESNSRPIYKNEKWFPTKTNDWVDVDGTFGKVIMQTPENITVRQLGGELVVFRSKDFYSANPINLSHGFSEEIIFGVDYAHQKVLFSEVIPNLKEGIKSTLMKHYGDKEKEFKEITVEFKSPGASSLDLRLFVKCTGVLACERDRMSRIIQSEMVRVCNANNYTIPFNQLTVHMQK